MKNIILLGAVVLSLFSFNAMAKINESDSRGVVVKKFYSGKPGYNRRVIKVYQQDYITLINKQLKNNPSAAGGTSNKKYKKISRLKLMKYRRHP